MWLALSNLRDRNLDVTFYFFLNDKYFVMLFSFSQMSAFDRMGKLVFPMWNLSEKSSEQTNSTHVQRRVQNGTWDISVESENSLFRALTVFSRFHILCIIVDGNTWYQVSFIQWWTFPCWHSFPDCTIFHGIFEIFLQFTSMFNWSLEWNIACVADGTK